MYVLDFLYIILKFLYCIVVYNLVKLEAQYLVMTKV